MSFRSFYRISDSNQSGSTLGTFERTLFWFELETTRKPPFWGFPYWEDKDICRPLYLHAHTHTPAEHDSNLVSPAVP